MHIELREDLRDVVADRDGRDEQVFGDAVGRQTLGHLAQDLLLAAGQRREGSRDGAPLGCGPFLDGFGELVLQRRGLSVRIAEHVDDGGERRVAAGDREGRRREPAHSPPGTGTSMRNACRVVVRMLARLRGDRAGRAAVAVSVDVATAHDVVAAPPENLVGGTAEKFLAGLVPEDDQVVAVQGENGLAAPGDLLQHFDRLSHLHHILPVSGPRRNLGFRGFDPNPRRTRLLTRRATVLQLRGGIRRARRISASRKRSGRAALNGTRARAIIPTR